MLKLTFLGATGTVTGSKYLVETGTRRILVDCGLFQGFKQLRLRNWKPLRVPPHTIDAVILTHAHIDHSGYLPLLAREGFKGPVYCTPATRDLLEILLPDSGHLQEEEARFANRYAYSKHRPALPLYTEDDARAALHLLRAVDFSREFELADRLRARFTPVGHILGAAAIELATPTGRIVFSGDLGRPRDPILRPPGKVSAADYLVVESTYGDRRHELIDPEEEFAAAINRTIHRGGVVIVPSFAVGRAQVLLHFIARLKQRQAIPNVPVFLNSPMASDVTRIYHTHRDEHRLSTEECAAMCATAEYVNSVESSKALDRRRGPMIIIAASGMATGGRVLHHLKTFAPDPRNLILFTGFQAPGTRGAALLGGAREIKIHGQLIPVRAEVGQLSAMSAHADADELLTWLGNLGFQPRKVFVTHGEPAAADRLRQRIEQELHWQCSVPEYLETVDLDGV